MIKYIGFIMGFLCVGLFLAWLSEEPRISPKSYDLASTYVIVNWFDSEKELQTALQDYSIAGLSDCEMRPDFNTSFCELWLVRPKSEYDFDTIGHEFYHALVGDFHD